MNSCRFAYFSLTCDAVWVASGSSIHIVVQVSILWPKFGWWHWPSWGGAVLCLYSLPVADAPAGLTLQLCTGIFQADIGHHGDQCQRKDIQIRCLLCRPCWCSWLACCLVHARSWQKSGVSYANAASTAQQPNSSLNPREAEEPMPAQSSRNNYGSQACGI